MVRNNGRAVYTKPIQKVIAGGITGRFLAVGTGRSTTVAGAAAAPATLVGVLGVELLLPHVVVHLHLLLLKLKLLLLERQLFIALLQLVSLGKDIRLLLLGQALKGLL